MAAIVVGRAKELGRALELVRGVGNGRFRAIVVHGDAGTGKTTLMRAACAGAGDEALVLTGSCLPLTSVSVPLMGLRSALRAVPTDERPPGLGRPSTPSESSSSDVAAPVPVAFDDWLSGRARQAPLVLAVDDIHWADAETLDVLTYVLAGPEERRLVLLLTVRTSEVGERHPLWRWLADARRLPGVEEMTLGPLSRDEIGEEVSLVLGAPAHSTLVDEVFERSQGNPYFARLLVTGLDQAASSLPTRLPEQLHAAALGSWSTLSDDAQRLLRSLAVAGRPALGRSLGRIAHVADLADPGPALREAVDVGLVDVGEDGSCWFHHPLQAEALELGLLPDERRVLHGRFAAGYEEDVGRGGDSGPDGDLAETISDHHILAGHEGAAYGWALRAASSRAGHDGIRRVRMLRRAVDLWPRLERVPESLDDLLDELRAAARDVGDWEEELAAVEELRAVVDPLTDALRVAVLDAWRSMLGFRLGIRGTVHDLRRAVELSADHPGTWQRVVVCCEHSRLLLWAGEVGRGRAALQEAVAVAENTPEPPVEDAGEWARARAYTWGQSAMLAAFERRAEGAVEVARRGAEEGATVRDGVTILHATFWGAAAVARGGPTWTEYVDEGRLLMERVGAPHRYVAWLSASMADDLFVFGDLRRCVERLRVALGSDAGLAGNYSARLTAAVLAAWQGRRDEAEGHLARSRELIEDGSAYPNFATARSTAWVLVLRGDALQAVDVAEAAMRREGPSPTGCEWLAPLAARGLADLVRTELDAGRSPESARSRLAALRDSFPHALEDAVAPTDHYAQMLAALDALYDAEVARAGIEGDATERWTLAAERLGAVGLPWDEAYASWRCGEALLADGGVESRRRAASLLRTGHSTAVRLGATPVRDSIEALARSARIPLTRVGLRREPAPGEEVVLTRREREVLAHVVAGRTYAEIAAALFVSEKTVSSHISNILHKTGTPNRVELAAWATRRGAGS